MPLTDTRERLSLLVIRLSLGVGGSFLTAAFVVQAFTLGGFMIPAAIATFILTALICYSFGKIRLTPFSLGTLLWVVVLALIRF